MNVKLKMNIFIHRIDVPEEKPTNSSAKAQSRRRRRRQSQPNSIQIENSENGKSTTVPPKTDDIIEIVNGDIGNPTDNNHHIVFDGPLDPESNYTGYLEVIGKMSSFFFCFLLKINFVD